MIRGVDRPLEVVDRPLLRRLLDRGQFLAPHLVQRAARKLIRALEGRPVLVDVRVIALEVGIAPRCPRRRVRLWSPPWRPASTLARRAKSARRRSRWRRGTRTRGSAGSSRSPSQTTSKYHLRPNRHRRYRIPPMSETKALASYVVDEPAGRYSRGRAPRSAAGDRQLHGVRGRRQSASGGRHRDSRAGALRRPADRQHSRTRRSASIHSTPR